MKKSTLLAGAAVGLSFTLTGGALMAFASSDHNPDRQGTTPATREFGVVRGLEHSSSGDLTAEEAVAHPERLFTLARGLKARVVTAGSAAPNLDMMALWPADHPKFVLACNEQNPSEPGIQRVDLATGAVATIVTGTKSCDPLHVTPWGTVIFGEETGDGHMYEMIDPVSIDNATLDRATGAASTDKIVRRDALGSVAFEGVGVLPSGVAYYGDELSPRNGTPGGSYFKFTPAAPWTGGPAITTLADSPLAAGTVAVLKIGQGSNTGQGMAYGDGTWLPVTPDAATGSLRAAANAAGGTGYYRPEDLSIDEKALANGDVRFCGNNTGREQAHYYGETICVTDGSTADAFAGTSTPQVQALVSGLPEINMPDNIAYQPQRGNWILHEDGETTFEGPHNDDLWSCLDDGPDADLTSDGCLRIASLNDLGAEWTGGFFDPTGKHFYVSIQHNKSGYGIVLDITGWR